MTLDVAQLHEFLGRSFPQIAGQVRVEGLTPHGLRTRLSVDDRHLRPGGTVSGPSIFALSDVSVYLAILSKIGEVALAVTTGGSIDFMRKPQSGRDLIADCRILKLGRALAVGEVHVRSEGSENLVARCSLTYSIPPKSP